MTRPCMRQRFDRQRFTRLILTLLLGLSLVPTVPALAAGPTRTVNSAGGADYTTTQAAVRNSGYTTINVAAGM